MVKNRNPKLIWWNRIVNAALLVVMLISAYSLFFPTRDPNYFSGSALLKQVEQYARSGLDKKALEQANTLDYTNIYTIGFGQANLLSLWPPGTETVRILARELLQLEPAEDADFRPEFAVRIGYVEEKGDKTRLTGFYYDRRGLVKSGNQVYRLSAAGQQLLNQELNGWVALTEVRNGFYLAACRRNWSALERFAAPAVIEAVRKGKIPAGEPVGIGYKFNEVQHSGKNQFVEANIEDTITLKNGRKFAARLTYKIINGRWQITGLN